MLNEQVKKPLRSKRLILPDGEFLFAVRYMGGGVYLAKTLQRKGYALCAKPTAKRLGGDALKYGVPMRGYVCFDDDYLGILVHALKNTTAFSGMKDIVKMRLVHELQYQCPEYYQKHIEGILHSYPLLENRPRHIRIAASESGADLLEGEADLEALEQVLSHMLSVSANSECRRYTCYMNSVLSLLSVRLLAGIRAQIPDIRVEIQIPDCPYALEHREEIKHISALADACYPAGTSLKLFLTQSDSHYLTYAGLQDDKVIHCDSLNLRFLTHKWDDASHTSL